MTKALICKKNHQGNCFLQPNECNFFTPKLQIRLIALLRLLRLLSSNYIGIYNIIEIIFNTMISISKTLPPLGKGSLQLLFKNYKQIPRPSIYQFSSRHSINHPKRQQNGGWHVMDTESIIRDLEIIYNSPENSEAETVATMRRECEQKLTTNRAAILKRFQQFKTILSGNKIELEKILAQIKLNTESMLESLDNVIASIHEFSKNIPQMNLHEIHAKSHILSFIARQIFKDNPKKSLFHQLAYILEVEIRLKSAFTYFDLYCPEERNITNSHPSLFPEVWKHIQIETFDSHEEIIKKYREIEEVLHATGGAIEKAQRYGINLLQKILFGIHLPINFIQYEWGLLNSLMFYRTASLESYRKFLNLYEDGFIHLITKYIYFPNIKTNTVIYIPPEGDFPEDLDIFKENKDYISVRVLYHKELPIIKSSKSKSAHKELQDIVVHMHGGGFVGLSSHTTQNYTRPWANQLKMPLFSIDYRMPPIHPYPHAPNDCLQVYKFLVNHLHRYMHIKPKNIYVCGDSAGGNLSCSLTALVMKNGLLKPKGLFLAYPCVDTRMIYYPSRKYIINDPLLWPSIALMFFNSYTNEKQRDDPIASPLLLSEEYISGAKGDKRFPLAWPRTYITLGSKDFLRDQSFLFMQRMVESNIPCKCFLFEHLRHAFFSTERLMKQSKQAFTHSITAFKELVEESKKEHL